MATDRGFHPVATRPTRATPAGIAVLVDGEDPAATRAFAARLREPFAGRIVTVGAEAALPDRPPDPQSPTLHFVLLRESWRSGLGVVRRLRAMGHRAIAVIAASVASMAGPSELLEAGGDDVLLEESEDDARLRTLVARHVGLPRPPLAEQRLLLGDSGNMVDVRRLVDQLASTSHTVLVLGETGTGKELVARELHERGRRRASPFVAVNCTALPGTLVESELFGHARGAFTGAAERRIGRFEEAADGTIFLDEIGDMPADAQVKLLRVLETRVFRPLGADRDVALGARVVAATHRDLEREIAGGRFRPDLYHRLAVIPIRMAPLRARPEDIAPLIERFVATSESPVAISPEAVEEMAKRSWPGNARELRNEVDRLSFLVQGRPVTAEDVRLFCRPPATDDAAEPWVGQATTAILGAPGRNRPVLRDALGVLEASLVVETLRRTAGNKTRAAGLLGLSLRGLVRKLPGGRG